MIKEHPFLITTTFQGDGTTIQYDANEAETALMLSVKAFKNQCGTASVSWWKMAMPLDGKGHECG